MSGENGPFYGIDSELGIHAVAKKWGQLRFFRPQCDRIAKTLDKALSATEAAAMKYPVGQFRYRLRRPPRAHLELTRCEETHFTEALWRQYASDQAPDVPFWLRVLSYEVEVRFQKDDARVIDLLAVNNDRCPVVVEVKWGALRSPLAALLQGVTYAIAINRDWENFRSQFHERLAQINVATRVPQDLKSAPLVCLARSQYWRSCFEHRCVAPHLPEFRNLLDAMGRRGFPCAFATVDCKDESGIGLPSIGKPRPLEAPGWKPNVQ